MRPIVVGDRRNGSNVQRRSVNASVTVGVTLAMLLAVGAVAGCGSVSNALPKADAGSGGSVGTGGSAGSGAGGADAAVDHVATSSGGAPGAGGAAGTNDASITDAIPDAPRDGGGCGVLASCAALHTCDSTLPSGNYMIAPDGPTDAAPVLVHCDMATGGGGWTVIYLADGINLNSTTIPYTVTSQKLRDNSQQALIAFRNLNLNMVASDWASFDLPATWRASNPLTVTPFEDLTVSASVNGALPALAKLRYGISNFGSLCGDDWNTTSNYGRVCLQGTAAAFYSGFSTAGGTTDFCATSTDTYSIRACSDMLRFSIAVR